MELGLTPVWPLISNASSGATGNCSGDVSGDRVNCPGAKPRKILGVPGQLRVKFILLANLQIIAKIWGEGEAGEKCTDFKIAETESWRILHSNGPSSLLMNDAAHEPSPSEV